MMVKAILETLHIIEDTDTDPRSFMLSRFDFGVLVEFNRKIDELAAEAASESDLKAPNITQKEFEDLISAGYFSSLYEESETVQEKIQVQIKSLHEVSEHQSEEEVRDMTENSIAILNSFLEELEKVRIDEDIADVAIAISGVEDDDKRRQIKKKVKETLKQEKAP